MESIREIRFSEEEDDVIEYCHTGAVTGPGQVGGQHFGTTYLYIRLKGGPWAKTKRRSVFYLMRATQDYPSARAAFASLAEPLDDQQLADGPPPAGETSSSVGSSPSRPSEVIEDGASQPSL